MLRMTVFVLFLLPILFSQAGCARKTANQALAPAGSPIDQGGPSNPTVIAPAIAAEPASDHQAATLRTVGGANLETVFFAFDSYVLEEEARRVLEKNATWLQENPSALITVEGHCDERGSDEYNLALGQRRAQAVRDYLTALGIAPERLGTISYGEEMPVDTGHGETAWQKNRRAQFQ